ncbi:MAG: hypothetical protein QX199_07955 [Methylococcaceae bacterium]
MALAISAFTTSLWLMQEIELRPEQQSRAMQEQLPSSIYKISPAE